MKLFSWLFGRQDRTLSAPREAEPAPREAQPAPPQEVHVASFALGFGARKRRGERRVAEHFLLGPGRYELRATRTGAGAYAPKGRSAPPPEGGWHHQVHLVLHAPIYPFEVGAPEAAPELPHLLFRNAEAPGPFARASEARDAFRAIPAEERRFTLDAPARAVFWIEMDQTPADGDMGLELIRLD